MRKALTTGTVIQLDCGGALRGFQIDRVIGTGANCIAYDAHCLNTASGAYLCRIKECYPFHAKIVRDDNLLVWDDACERAVAFAKMRKTHSVLVDLRNSSEVGNSITTAFLCEGNGTLYSVMEVNHAQTFDREDTTDLYALLETMRVLTQIVGNLHKKGYLHLDIKPENFLVTHDPSTSIWLFDVDSLTELSALHKGTVRSISCSPEWAAPEQIRGLTGKLCAATDLYAIGAILFHRIMGRFPVNADMGLFADWSFDLPLLKKQNPRLCSYLREIFHKTLAASVKRRYQEASALSEILAKASLLVKAKMPFLLPNCPADTTALLGRQSDLFTIQNAFHSGHRYVFLHGEGGIGKSTLAVSFGNLHKAEYDAVVFLRYRNSFVEALNTLQLCNYEKNFNDGETKAELVKSLLDDHTLVILDNYDVATEEAEDLEEILSCGANFIITTRTDFSDLISKDVTQLEVGHIADQDLIHLILSPSKLSSHETQNFSIAALLNTIGRNTYAAELLGRQMLDAGWSLDTLTAQISSGIERLDSAPKIRAMKNGRIQKRTFPDWLRVLFRIADLDEQAQLILRNLYLLRYIEIDKTAYRRIALESKREIDTINDLTERGWIRTDGKLLSLHPLVEALVKADLQPDTSNCEAVFYHFSMLGDDCIPPRYSDDDNENEFYPSWDSEIEEYTAKKNTEILFAFFKGLDLNNRDHRRYVVKWLLDALTNGVDLPESLTELESSSVFHQLSKVCEAHKVSAQELYEIRLVFFNSCLLQYHMIYIGETREARNTHRNECLIGAYHQAIEAARALPVSKRREAEISVGKLFIRFVKNYSWTAIPEEVVKPIYANCPELFESDSYGISKLKQQCGLALTTEQQEQMNRLDNLGRKKPVENDNQEKAGQQDLAGIAHRYNEAEDKISFVRGLLNDDSIPVLLRVRFVRKLLGGFFSRLHDPYYYYYAPNPEYWYSKKDWQFFYALLKIELEFLDNHFEDEITENPGDLSIKDCYNGNDLDLLAVNAALSNARDVQEYFSSRLASIKECLEDRLQEVWEPFYLWNRGLPWLDLINAENTLNNLNRTHYLIPFLQEYVVFIESESSKADSPNIDILFAVYKTVVDNAMLSSRESELSEQERAQYSTIAATYQKKLDEITSTTIHPVSSVD